MFHSLYSHVDWPLWLNTDTFNSKFHMFNTLLPANWYPWEPLVELLASSLLKQAPVLKVCWRTRLLHPRYPYFNEIFQCFCCLLILESFVFPEMCPALMCIFTHWRLNLIILSQKEETKVKLVSHIMSVYMYHVQCWFLESFHLDIIFLGPT